LASVDVSRLAPADVFAVLAAQQRMVAHYQAQMLTSLYEAGRVTYADGACPLDRRDDYDRFSADEASFTLHWSVEATKGYQFLAERLIRRLPAAYPRCTRRWPTDASTWAGRGRFTARWCT
jgi:hypothetical protein